MRVVLQLTEFHLDGVLVHAEDEGTLLDAIREGQWCRAPKDGCSPQGQCGCCTVLVDGAARVSCVTPVRRVEGRSVTTTEGLPGDLAERWSEAFVAAGASQCGFCTPGIVLRLSALEGRAGLDEQAVRTALLAHLCRCTGWQTIVEAACSVLSIPLAHGPKPSPGTRDPLLTAWRTQLEGPAFQASGPSVVLGGGRFADDTAPGGALVALAEEGGGYVVADSLPAARRASAKVQGRRTTIPLRHPVDLPEGDWELTLQTTWVEPSYLEPDASWCTPTGFPAPPLANGGAFGGKRRSPVPEAARELAAEKGRAVRVLWPREEVVRRGPKRPPVAIGIRADGTGVARVARTPGAVALDVVAARMVGIHPGLSVEEVEVAGPPVSSDLRGSGLVEALAIQSGLRARLEGRVGPGCPVEVHHPAGGRARVTVEAAGTVHAEVWAGEVLDEVTLRSYCIGAVHQALGWVWSEGIAVDENGSVHDLTIRSFGILSARATPHVEVTVHPSDLWPVNGSDAVMAATAAAAWIAEGLPPRWPTRRGGSS